MLILRFFNRGGFFAGKITSLDDPAASGGRFDANIGRLGQLYRARYLNDGYFEALKFLQSVAVCFNLTTTVLLRGSTDLRIGRA